MTETRDRPAIEVEAIAAARAAAIAMVARDIQAETDCAQDHARYLAEERVNMVIEAFCAQKLLAVPPLVE